MIKGSQQPTKLTFYTKSFLFFPSFPTPSFICQILSNVENYDIRYKDILGVYFRWYSVDEF